MLGSSTLGEAVIKTRLDTTGLKSGLQEAEKLAGGFALGGSSKTGTGGNPYAKQLDEQRQQIRLLMNEYRVAGGNAQEFANKLRTLAQQNLTTAKNITDNAKASGQFATIAGAAASAADRLEGKINKLSFAYQLQQGIQGRVQTSLYAMGPAGSVAANGLGITSAAMGGLSIGATAGVAALAGLGIAYSKLEKRGTDLNRQIERDNVILRQSADNFEEIAQKIDSFGAGFEDIAAQYNKADITRGVTELVKAGREASETFNILEVATKVASIENENLNDVALGTSQVLRQFKLDVEDAGKAGDVLTRGSLEAQGSITGLITGLSVVGPVAELAGLSLEETVAALVQLDQKGQDYADIGATALRSAISQLLDPSKEAKGVLDALGITATSGRDKFMQLTDAMASGEISAEQLAVIFDTRAVTAVANLDSNVFDLIGTMNEAGGELDTLANEMADTLEAAELRAKTAWDNVGTAISEGTLGMRTDMNEWSANVATNVEKAIRKMNEWGAWFVEFRNNNLANGGLFGLFPQLAGPDGGGGRGGGVGLTLGNESTVGNNPNAIGFSTNQITLGEIQSLISQLEAQRKEMSADSPELADLNKRIAALREQANAFYPTRNPTGGTGLGGSGTKIRTVTGELSDYNKQLALNANLLTETARIEADLKTNKSFLTDLLNPDVQGSRGGLVAQIEAEIASLEARQDALKDTEKAQKDYEQSMERLKGVYDDFNNKFAELQSEFGRGNLSQGELDKQQLSLTSNTINQLEAFVRAGTYTDYTLQRIAELKTSEQTLQALLAPAPTPTPRTPELAGYFGLQANISSPAFLQAIQQRMLAQQIGQGYLVNNQMPVYTSNPFDAVNQRNLQNFAPYLGKESSLPSYIADPTAGNIGAENARILGVRRLNQEFGDATVEAFQDWFYARLIPTVNNAGNRVKEAFDKVLPQPGPAGKQRNAAELAGYFGLAQTVNYGNNAAFYQGLLNQQINNGYLVNNRMPTNTANPFLMLTGNGFANAQAAANLSNQFSGSNLDAYTRQALLKGLPNGGSITSDAQLVDALRGQGMSTEQIDDALNGLATKVDESADSFNSKIVDAAGQVASVFTQIATGKATPGGVVSGLGGAAAGIVGTFNPLAGQIVGVASGILGGIFDAFGQDDKKRKEEALRNQNRQLPTLNIDFAFNQYNQWTGQPSDPENVGALTQQSGEMAMLVEKVILPAIQQHSNKLGLSTP